MLARGHRAIPVSSPTDPPCNNTIAPYKTKQLGNTNPVNYNMSQITFALDGLQQ